MTALLSRPQYVKQKNSNSTSGNEYNSSHNNTCESYAAP